MKTDFPKITVVTVTYNAEQYLEQTIKSVIEQDYPNIEYIIIDGASTDGTIDIIKKYEKHLSYWISEPDSGIYDAMNKGIDVATGEWIQFLNAGDTLIHNQTINIVSKYLIDTNDLVHGKMWRNKPYRKLTEPYCNIHSPLDGCFIWHPTLFAKLSIMKKHKYNTYFKIAGDYDFFLTALKENYTIKLIDEPITDYLENGVSQSDNLRSNIESLFSQLNHFYKNEEILKSKIVKSLLNQIPLDNLSFSKDLNKIIKNAQNLLFDKKFVLYGYGLFGKLIYEEFKNSILDIVDINYKNFNKELKIKSIETLRDTKFDYIFISVLGREEEIFSYLVNDLKIASEKILFLENSEKFNSSKYWEKRYAGGGNSGAGSYNNLAKFKANVINDFIKTNSIKNILEFGCGDGNNLALYDIENYIGIDVSLKAIEICKTKFNNDKSKSFFTLNEFTKIDKAYKTAKLVLSLDVIYHLVEDNIFNDYMNNLFESSSKFIIIYSSNHNEILTSHVKHRKFTDWIKNNKKDWKLKEYIKNIFPWNPEEPNNTSFADFYIYERDSQ
ncbi:glycosyltransferase [Aliarcobacter cryaerophilus]|uniref:glycosyltransferase n=1 Tax=Aliarcobacter cryaerophilus TaxID=28198 RepID=UPI003DA2D01F